jgi:putative two-component system response regulator
MARIEAPSPTPSFTLERKPTMSPTSMSTATLSPTATITPETFSSLVPGVLRTMPIVILDDDTIHTTLLEITLRSAGFKNVQSINNPHELSSVLTHTQPDLLLLDLNMPFKSGLDVLEDLNQQFLMEDRFPVVMLSASERVDMREQALALGAKDFISKPFRSTEVILRVRNILETRHFYLAQTRQSERLEKLVQARTAQLEQSQVEMLIRLARTAEYRDDEAGEHIWRVAQLSAQLARKLGLDETRADLLLRAARLHDVGKVAVPDSILMKPSQLDQEEFEAVKRHTLVGAELLSGSQSPLLKIAQTIALTHHERWDGKGYPRGLKGETIPLEGRILAVADSFDALTHHRSYRTARTLEQAVTEISAQSGKQFDPKVVAAFLELYQEGALHLFVG